MRDSASDEFTQLSEQIDYYSPKRWMSTESVVAPMELLPMHRYEALCTSSSLKMTSSTEKTA